MANKRICLKEKVISDINFTNWTLLTEYRRYCYFTKYNHALYTSACGTSVMMKYNLEAGTNWINLLVAMTQGDIELDFPFHCRASRRQTGISNFVAMNAR